MVIKFSINTESFQRLESRFTDIIKVIGFIKNYKISDFFLEFNLEKIGYNAIFFAEFKNKKPNPQSNLEFDVEFNYKFKFFKNEITSLFQFFSIFTKDSLIEEKINQFFDLLDTFVDVFSKEIIISSEILQAIKEYFILYFKEKELLKQNCIEGLRKYDVEVLESKIKKEQQSYTPILISNCSDVKNTKCLRDFGFVNESDQLFSNPFSVAIKLNIFEIKQEKKKKSLIFHSNKEVFLTMILDEKTGFKNYFESEPFISFYLKQFSKDFPLINNFYLSENQLIIELTDYSRIILHKLEKKIENNLLYYENDFEKYVLKKSLLLSEALDKICIIKSFQYIPSLDLNEFNLKLMWEDQLNRIKNITYSSLKISKIDKLAFEYFEFKTLKSFIETKKDSMIKTIPPLEQIGNEIALEDLYGFIIDFNHISKDKQNDLNEELRNYWITNYIEPDWSKRIYLELQKAPDFFIIDEIKQFVEKERKVFETKVYSKNYPIIDRLQIIYKINTDYCIVLLFNRDPPINFVLKQKELNQLWKKLEEVYKNEINISTKNISVSNLTIISENNQSMMFEKGQKMNYPLLIQKLRTDNNIADEVELIIDSISIRKNCALIYYTASLDSISYCYGDEGEFEVNNQIILSKVKAFSSNRFIEEAKPLMEEDTDSISEINILLQIGTNIAELQFHRYRDLNRNENIELINPQKTWINNYKIERIYISMDLLFVEITFGNKIPTKEFKLRFSIGEPINLLDKDKDIRLNLDDSEAIFALTKVLQISKPNEIKKDIIVDSVLLLLNNEKTNEILNIFYSKDGIMKSRYGIEAIKDYFDKGYSFDNIKTNSNNSEIEFSTSSYQWKDKKYKIGQLIKLVDKKGKPYPDECKIISIIPNTEYIEIPEIEGFDFELTMKTKFIFSELP